MAVRALAEVGRLALQGLAGLAAFWPVVSGQAAVGFELQPVTTVRVTAEGEGGSARPEIAAAAERVFVLYLSHIRSGERTFEVKIYDRDLSEVVGSRVLVEHSTEHGSPTDIRVAVDGDTLFAFYETYRESPNAATNATYLWGAKYALDDGFALLAQTDAPIASSGHLADIAMGAELLDDPAPLVGPDAVYVVTRLKHELAATGDTVYRVRAFAKDDLAPLWQRDLDLSTVADGRGRVASLLWDGDHILMALPTTVGDVVAENVDDGAPQDVVLVALRSDWTLDPQRPPLTLADGRDDRENYVSGLARDGERYYLSYKQAVGRPPTGEQRAWIRVFDGRWTLLTEQQVRATTWGPDGGEVRPSLTAQGGRLFSGQSTGASLGAGDAQVIEYRVEVPTAPPAAPSHLVATIMTSRRVALTWSDLPDETSYVVEARRGTADFATVAELAADVTRLVVKGLQPGARYAFRVRARNAAGYSPYSLRAVVLMPH